MQETKKQIYETPIVEVVEVDMKTSIAASAEGVGLWEELW